MMKWSQIMKDNYDAIVDKMIELDSENYKFQVDLYIYPDGSLDEFVNVGGNSWLNDDHYTICYFNNEHNDVYDQIIEDEKNGGDSLRSVCEDNRRMYEECLDSDIEEAEREEELYDSES